MISLIRRVEQGVMRVVAQRLQDMPDVAEYVRCLEERIRAKDHLLAEKREKLSSLKRKREANEVSRDNRMYRRVSPRIWSDAKFRSLGDSSKLLFLHLLTHAELFSFGAMRFVPQQLETHLSWTSRVAKTSLSELASKGFVEFDAECGLIVIVNYLKYNPPQNPNMVSAWGNLWDRLPECELLDQLVIRAYSVVRDLGEQYSKQFSIPFPKRFPEGLAQGLSKPLPEPDSNGVFNKEEGRRKKEEGTLLEELPDWGRSRSLRAKWSGLMNTWGDTYPQVDIPLEIRRAYAWDCSQERRKKHIPRFLNSWLNNATKRRAESDPGAYQDDW